MLQALVFRQFKDAKNQIYYNRIVYILLIITVVSTIVTKAISATTTTAPPPTTTTTTPTQVNNITAIEQRLCDDLNSKISTPIKSASTVRRSPFNDGHLLTIVARGENFKFPIWLQCSNELKLREPTQSETIQDNINRNRTYYMTARLLETRDTYDDPNYRYLNTIVHKCQKSILKNCKSFRVGLLGQESSECPTCGDLNDLNCENVQLCTNSCGQIKSINYPFNYGNNHRCRWSIKAPNTHYVKLRIIDFDIPSSKRNSSNEEVRACIFDYLTLIDGYTGKRLGCYCNENLPPPFIVSPWNELIIQFDTNKDITGRGFYFEYEFMRLKVDEHIRLKLQPPTPPTVEMSSTTVSGGYDLNKAAAVATGSSHSRIVSTNTMTAMTNPSACPSGWKYFRGSCYQAFNELEPLQWYDAENKCELHGKGLDGHLVSILDKDEMLVIQHFLTNEWHSPRYRDYYIGLIDVSREGIYRWSDSNPMSYTDWQIKPLLLEEDLAAQPDGGAYEDCTIIRYNSFSHTTNWHDVPCSLGKHYQSQLDKSPQFSTLRHYVNSYICKSDSLIPSSRAKARRPLFSNEFKPSMDSSHLISHLAGMSITSDGAHKPGSLVISNLNNNNNNNNNNNTSVAQRPSSPTAPSETTNKPNETLALTSQQLAAERNRFYLSILDDNRYFVCDDLEVISVVLRCDGVAHCRDGSDESHGCDQDCLDWQFKCANGRCISIGSYCDFVDDCGDGSDESRCERIRCKLNEFRCNTGQCIPGSQRCDLQADCSDSSDEGRLCTIGSNCQPTSTFQCYNGYCIPQYAVCDFQHDCPGKFHEDEELATCDVILKSRALDYNYSYALSPSHDGSPVVYYLANQEPVGGHWVKQNQFKCTSGNMIDANLRCIYEFDKYGYQIGCRDVSHLIGCSDFDCPQRDYVKCPDSYCIPWRYVCDGKWDCIMGDDEVGCARYVCPGQYKCANQSSCILLHQLCDGHRQCPMGDDEWYCDLQCPIRCDCIGQSVNCRSANLTNLPSNYISKYVRKLDLSYNRLGPNLSQSDFSAYHDLGELILNHNNIEVLIPRKFSQLRNLYKLDLSYNQIHSVKRGAFAGLRRVTQLLLESNPELIIIEPEAFLGLSSLRFLNISSSRIQALRKNTFDGLTSLRHLHLRSNMIIEVEDSAFRSLSSLLSLDMRGNEIRYFTKLVFNDLKSLRNLSTDSFKFCCLVQHQIPTEKCLPLPDEISDCEDLLSSPLQRTCNWIAGGVALVGNLIVIVWRLRDRRKEREEDNINSMLLLSLGLSDLIMGICQIMIAIVDSYYRGRYIENADNWRKSALCNLCGFLSTISIEASVVTLVWIARNRIIMASWLFALIIATLPLLVTLYFRGQFYARSGVCLAFHITNQKAAGWLYSISDAFNLMAFVYIANCYTKIYFEISRSVGNREHPSHPVKIAMIVLTHFLACLPAIILRLMTWAGVPLPAAVYSWIAVLVLPANSAINPMIYTIPNIRRQIQLLIRNHRLRKSASFAASLDITQQNNRRRLALLNKKNTNPTKIAPILSGGSDKLLHRNVPPGYIPLRQFVRQCAEQHPAQLHMLVSVLASVSRDIESKHRESRIYTSLNVDCIYVCTNTGSEESNIRQPTQANGASIPLMPTSHQLSIDKSPANTDLPDEQQQQLLARNDCVQNTSTVNRLAGLSNGLTVYVADHHGYQRKKSRCKHESTSGVKHHHRSFADCECNDVERFAELMFNTIQLFNMRRLELADESNKTPTT